MRFPKVFKPVVEKIVSKLSSQSNPEGYLGNHICLFCGTHMASKVSSVLKRPCIDCAGKIENSTQFLQTVVENYSPVYAKTFTCEKYDKETTVRAFYDRVHDFIFVEDMHVSGETSLTNNIANIHDQLWDYLGLTDSESRFWWLLKDRDGVWDLWESRSEYSFPICRPKRVS